MIAIFAGPPLSGTHRPDIGACPGRLGPRSGVVVEINGSAQAPPSSPQACGTVEAVFSTQAVDSAAIRDLLGRSR